MKKFFLSLALAFCLVLSAAGVQAAAGKTATAPAVKTDSSPAVSTNNPVDQLTGVVWQKTSPEIKASFIFGVETAITVEYFVNAKGTEKSAKTGKRPVYTLSPFEKGWMTAFKDSSRENIIQAVDDWYTANPKSLDRPVMSVIWFELIEPRLKAAK